jgi:hypothetical protein
MLSNWGLQTLIFGDPGGAELGAATDLEEKGPGARLQWGKGKEEPSTRLIPICISHIYSGVKPEHGILRFWL